VGIINRFKARGIQPYEGDSEVCGGFTVSIIKLYHFLNQEGSPKCSRLSNILSLAPGVLRLL
jgi:hypothetical protein